MAIFNRQFNKPEYTINDPKRIFNPDLADAYNKYQAQLNAALQQAGFADVSDKDTWAKRQEWLAKYKALNPPPQSPVSYGPVNRPVLRENVLPVVKPRYELPISPKRQPQPIGYDVIQKPVESNPVSIRNPIQRRPMYSNNNFITNRLKRISL